MLEKPSQHIQPNPSSPPHAHCQHPSVPHLCISGTPPEMVTPLPPQLACASAPLLSLSSPIILVQSSAMGKYLSVPPSSHCGMYLGGISIFYILI